MIFLISMCRQMQCRGGSAMLEAYKNVAFGGFVTIKNVAYVVEL